MYSIESSTDVEMFQCDYECIKTVAQVWEYCTTMVEECGESVVQRHGKVEVWYEVYQYLGVWLWVWSEYTVREECGYMCTIVEELHWCGKRFW